MHTSRSGCYIGGALIKQSDRTEFHDTDRGNADIHMQELLQEKIPHGVSYPTDILRLMLYHMLEISLDCNVIATTQLFFSSITINRLY